MNPGPGTPYPQYPDVFGIGIESAKVRTSSPDEVSWRKPPRWRMFGHTVVDTSSRPSLPIVSEAPENSAEFAGTEIEFAGTTAQFGSWPMTVAIVPFGATSRITEFTGPKDVFVRPVCTK